MQILTLSKIQSPHLCVMHQMRVREHSGTKNAQQVSGKVKGYYGWLWSGYLHMRTLL